MSGSTSTLERIKHHTFELRDKRSRRPSVNAGVFVKAGTRAGFVAKFFTFKTLPWKMKRMIKNKSLFTWRFSPRPLPHRTHCSSHTAFTQHLSRLGTSLRYLDTSELGLIRHDTVTFDPRNEVADGYQCSRAFALLPAASPISSSSSSMGTGLSSTHLRSAP